jgi:hypothetical protein
MTADRVAGFAVVLVALGQLACHSLVEGAKADFSRSFSCPVDRVEVRARPDLHPSDWFETRTPQNEIASDPGRLRLWQDEQERLRTSEDKYHSIYEARGCGHHVLYQCGRTTSGSSSGASVLCRERPYRTGVSRW